MPAASAVGRGGNEFADRGQGAQPLRAPEHLHGVGGQVAQPRGAFEAGLFGEDTNPVHGGAQGGVVGPVD